MRMRQRRRAAGLLALLSLLIYAPAGAAADAAALVARVKRVGPEGAGNEQAARAWRELTRLGPDALPAILAGMDGAGPVATNWLRAAVDAVAERQVKAGKPLPADRLEAFVRDKQHSGQARRLAYEWLVRVDAGAPRRLLPGMLHDPSPELRRDAVARAMDEAHRLLARGDKAAATAAYRKAFSGALDRDQVDEIVKQLRALGVSADPASHLGFIRRWLLLGPLDSSGETGFRKVFPPEKGVDLAARYRGKGGAEVRWLAYTTPDPYGVVDLNKAVGKANGATAYAYAVVESPARRDVELRAGSNNAVALFLNGKPVFSREEYHHGMRMDQHVGKGTLRSGRNTILVKVRQNEQKEDWAQNWSFQLRVCDATGAAVPLKVIEERPGARAGKEEARR